MVIITIHFVMYWPQRSGPIYFWIEFGCFKFCKKKVKGKGFIHQVLAPNKGTISSRTVTIRFLPREIDYDNFSPHVNFTKNGWFRWGSNPLPVHATTKLYQLGYNSQFVSSSA